MKQEENKTAIGKRKKQGKTKESKTIMMWKKAEEPR